MNEIAIYKYKRRNKVFIDPRGGRHAHFVYTIVYPLDNPKSDKNHYFIEWAEEDFYVETDGYIRTDMYYTFLTDVKWDYRLITSERNKKYIMKQIRITKIAFDAKHMLLDEDEEK